MSRAEKKLAELKAKEELKKIKAEKREKQQQDWEEAKKKWKALPNGVKTTLKIIGGLLLLLILIGIFSPSDAKKEQDNDQADASQESSQNDIKVETQPVEKTDQEKMFESVSSLISTKEAFDTGSYIKGDIPVGEYVYMPFEGSGQYYSEEDSAGNIIDNENFDSFGYVYVHGAGNIQTRGVLIKIGSVGKLGVTSAKAIYEDLNNKSDYIEAGIYKVGVDIAPGTYTIESYGEGYVEVMSGPVGNNDIIDNEIFNGKYSVNVRSGQYLKVSRGKIIL